MKRAVGIAYLVLFLTALPEGGAQADEDTDLSYNIFGRDDHVMVWIDLASAISSAQIEKIKDGMDLLLEYELELVIPKRLWGKTSVARKLGAVRISYRLVTQEFSLASSADSWQEELRFLSVKRLLGHLADSIEVQLVPFDSLDATKRYVLELTVTRVSVMAFGLTPTGADSARSASPLQFLFRQFLILTGFARNKIETKSRRFSPSEIIFEP
jgi:hypothetical protein